MSRFRLSVVGLIGLIALLGFDLAALKGTSPYWLLGTCLVTLTALLAAILGAIFRRGRARAFWIGFALFGWAFLYVFDRSNNTFVFGLQGIALTDLSDEIGFLFGKDPSLDQEGVLLLESALLFALTGGLVARLLVSRQESEGRSGVSSDPGRTP